MAVSRNPFNGTMTGAFLDLTATTSANSVTIQVVDDDGNSVPGARSFSFYAVDTATHPPLVNQALATTLTASVGAIGKVAAAGAAAVETYRAHTSMDGTLTMARDTAATGTVYIGIDFNNNRIIASIDSAS